MHLCILCSGKRERDAPARAGCFFTGAMLATQGLAQVTSGDGALCRAVLTTGALLSLSSLPAALPCTRT